MAIFQNTTLKLFKTTTVKTILICLHHTVVMEFNVEFVQSCEPSFLSTCIWDFWKTWKKLYWNSLKICWPFVVKEERKRVHENIFFTLGGGGLLLSAHYNFVSLYLHIVLSCEIKDHCLNHVFDINPNHQYQALISKFRTIIPQREHYYHQWHWLFFLLQYCMQY